MKADRIRSLLKRFAPYIVGGVVLGTASAATINRFLGDDCCAAGAACCHPGAACCHGHHASGGVAQR
jgi:hypothetical protein